MVQHHWQDDPTLSLELLKPRNEGSDANNNNAHIPGPHNGHTPAITTEIGCLSSPLVMDLRLGVKDWSKSAGWACSTVICMRRPVVPLPHCVLELRVACFAPLVAVLIFEFLG